MALQSLDVIRRSASISASPNVRETLEVAKLIDVSKCIGCKACQVACMEWNDVRDDIGRNVGVYDNPHRPHGPLLDGHAVLRGGAARARVCSGSS